MKSWFLAFGLLSSLVASAGTGDLCPGGAKVISIVDNLEGRYVKCDDNKIYLLTGGGINGSSEPANYKLAESGWPKALDQASGSSDRDGFFSSQFSYGNGSMYNQPLYGCELSSDFQLITCPGGTIYQKSAITLDEALRKGLGMKTKKNKKENHPSVNKGNESNYGGSGGFNFNGSGSLGW